jgi:hypothetical protein
MWSTAAFKKVCGVTPDADVAALEGALVKASQSRIDKEVAQALLCRQLKGLNWKSSAAAQAYGITAAAYARNAQRGDLLWTLGEDNHTAKWLQIVSIGTGDGILVDTYQSLLTAQADTDANGKERSAEQVRAARFEDQTRRRAIAQALGDNATTDKIDAVNEMLSHEGLSLPVQWRNAIPAIAKHLEIPLAPPTQRNGGTGPSTTVPTVAAAKAALKAAQADRLNADMPETYGPEEIADLEYILSLAARMMKKAGVEPYAIVNMLAGYLDAIQLNADMEEPVQMAALGAE